jgi:hypothetical protein
MPANAGIRNFAARSEENRGCQTFACHREGCTAAGLHPSVSEH